VRVIGVQASNSPAIAQVFKGVRNKNIPFLPTIAEGICVKEPGKLTVDIIRNYVDDIVTVTEQEITSTILFMLEREKLLVEGAAAAAIAAVVNKRLPFSSEKTGVIVSGGNFDLRKLSECMGQSTNNVQNF
jgi:threonine dehydratase